MNIGTLDTLRAALGGNVGRTYAQAAKMACARELNITFGRKFDVDVVVAWMNRKKGFRMTSVYPNRNVTQRSEPQNQSRKILKIAGCR